MGKESTVGVIERLNGCVLSDFVPGVFAHPENIRQLVARNRTPVILGRIGTLPRNPTKNDEWKYRVYYTVPPVGFTDGDIKEVGVDCGAAPELISTKGEKLRSAKYLVSESAAKRIEEIIAESKKVSD